MINATVIYHREDGVWWAEAPEAEGWSAAADTYAGLRELVREGLEFHFETTEFRMDERLADGAPIRHELWTSSIDVFAGAVAKVTAGLGRAEIAPARAALTMDRAHA